MVSPHILPTSRICLPYHAQFPAQKEILGFAVRTTYLASYVMTSFNLNWCLLASVLVGRKQHRSQHDPCHAAPRYLALILSLFHCGMVTHIANHVDLVSHHLHSRMTGNHPTFSRMTGNHPTSTGLSRAKHKIGHLSSNSIRFTYIVDKVDMQQRFQTNSYT